MSEDLRDCWAPDQLLDPADWDAEKEEMPEFCRRIADGDKIIDGGEEVRTMIGKNELLGWFVVGRDAADTEKRVIWHEREVCSEDGEAKEYAGESEEAWNSDDLVDPADWDGLKRSMEMPAECWQAANGTESHAMIGKNETLGWFVAVADSRSGPRRLIWSEKKRAASDACDGCPYAEQCIEQWGIEEYRSAIGTRHCRASWNPDFTRENPPEMINNSPHGTCEKGEWRRDALRAYKAEIYVAGDIETCKRVCRQECFRKGLCVTVEPVTYVFTGGAEEGVRVGLIQYPPFPASEESILERAVALGELLAEACCQWSYAVCSTDRHVFCSRRRK
jgi:hypothetical protein